MASPVSRHIPAPRNYRHRSAGSSGEWIDGKSLAPTRAELTALAVCGVAFGVLYLSSAFVVVRVGLPIALIGILGAAAWSAARADSSALWTPLFGFRIGNIAFTGLGSLVPYVVSDAQLDRIYWLYAFTDQEAAKVLLLWLAYILSALLGVTVAAFFSPRIRASLIGEKIAWLGAARLGSAFYAAGLFYAVVIDLGVGMGWHSVVLPGAVSTIFQAINAVGIFLLVLVALERGGGWYPIAIGVFLTSISIGLVIYNKSMVLFPILLVAIALLVQRVTLMRAFGAAAAMFLALSVLQPAIEFARNEHARTFGRGEGAMAVGGTIPERIGILATYWTVGPDDEEKLGSGITRLSYLNVGSYLVAQYDLGLPGDTMGNAAIALVPRFIWPDKPILTDVGLELNEKLFGSTLSFVAPSAVGDIYWNLGWGGVVVLGFMFGIAIWFGTLVASGIIRRQDWFMMPFILVAFRTAIQTEQGFVVGIFVPTVFAFLLLFALRLSKQLLAHSARQ